MRRWCAAAGVWVAAFTVAHVHWYAGGTAGKAGPLPELRLDAFSVAVWAGFAAGLVVPWAAARRPTRLLRAFLLAGAVLLLLRGGAGHLDDLLRATGHDGGLTGLTVEQVLGTAHPSAAQLWTGRLTDAYFTLGGLLFAAAAARSGKTRPQGPGGAPRAGSPDGAEVSG